MDLVLLRNRRDHYALAIFACSWGYTFSQICARDPRMKLRQLAQDFFGRSSCTFVPQALLPLSDLRAYPCGVDHTFFPQTELLSVVGTGGIFNSARPSMVGTSILVPSPPR